MLKTASRFMRDPNSLKRVSKERLSKAIRDWWRSRALTKCVYLVMDIMMTAVLEACRLRASEKTFSSGTSRRTLMLSKVRKGEASSRKRESSESTGAFSARR